MDEQSLKIDTEMAEKRKNALCNLPWMALLNVYRHGPRVNSFFVKYIRLPGIEAIQCHSHI